MKKILILLSLQVLMIQAAWAQQHVGFTVCGGIGNELLKSRIEGNISLLLSEINSACAEGRGLQTVSLEMTSNAVRSLSLLWENLHFLCEQSQISEECHSTVNGYQLRNIPIHVIPVAEGYEGARERQLTISLTKEGQITGVRMAMPSRVYQNVIKQGDSTDTARREEILKFVEDFRSHYDEKDIHALEQVFSDDALIITGTVVMKSERKGDQISLRSEIVYHTQNKQQYLTRLRHTFARNKYIKVTFSDPEVVRSKKNPNYFGVTLHQHWKSSNYEDDGYVFLLWEFRENGLPPIIHVRTWQPDRLAGAQLAKDKIINILDFEIPSKRRAK